MDTSDLSDVIRGDGWAIRRAGSFVLGIWNAPMTEERVEACARLYREAQRAHGHFTVLAVFRTNPFPLDVVANEGSRNAVVGMLDEFGSSFDAVISVVDATGFQASLIRMAAATVTRLVGRGVPLFFPSSIDEGIARAHERGSFFATDEATVRRVLTELDAVTGLDAAS